jgi:hypothetical protein
MEGEAVGPANTGIAANRGGKLCSEELEFRTDTNVSTRGVSAPGSVPGGGVLVDEFHPDRVVQDLAELVDRPGGAFGSRFRQAPVA